MRRPVGWLLAVPACVLLLWARGPGAARAQAGGGLRERLRERREAAQAGAARHPAAETIRLAGLRVSVWRPKSASGPEPLVLFSHGFHGSSTQSSFLMASLAEAGYLVLAPNHRDALGTPGVSLQPEVSFAHASEWTDKTYRDRADDLRNLLAALQADPEWKRRIDWKRVGVAGHSLGGYTALGIAGGWPAWKAPEIRAVLALSPYCTPFLQSRTLGRLGVPVMYQGGTLDLGITPFLQRTGGAYDLTAGPAYLVELEGAGHFAWTDLNARHQETICRYSRAFLDRYLKGDRSADPAMKLSGITEVRNK